MIGKIHNEDMLTALRKVRANSIDAIVTDPPYGVGMDNALSDFDDPDRCISFDSSTWRECLRVLKPGGHTLAFGGARTVHRIATAIESAGFEIRDMMAWLYGSGFPKSIWLDDAKTIGTALKPSFEPIVLARKPPGGAASGAHAKHGTGGLNIEACRLESTAAKYATVGDKATREASVTYGQGFRRRQQQQQQQQRWPPTLAIDEYVAAQLGAAALFFYCPKTSKAERNIGLDGFSFDAPGLIGRKPDSAGLKSPRAGGGRQSIHNRNPHPTVKPIELMRWLVRLVTPPGGVVLDPFAGSGSTLCAAQLEGRRWIGVELNPLFAEVARRRVECLR